MPDAINLLNKKGSSLLFWTIRHLTSDKDSGDSLQ